MSFENIPISKLKISEFNVRKDVGDVSELAAAVKEQGVLQPLLVRPEDGKFGVIIGSRRYTAAMEANLSKVPAMVKEMNDDKALVVSLVENLQRNDLAPKETAGAIAKLLETHTLRELGEKIGKSYVYVQNYSRLVNLVNRLEGHSIRVAVQPSDTERSRGRVLPLNHAIHLANTLEYSNVRDFFGRIESEQADNLTIELAQAIAPIKQTDAQKVLEIWKREPDRPIERIVEEVESGTGLGLREYDDDDERIHIHEMPTETFEDQVHHKIMWNLKRTSETYDFYTIGYGHIEFRQFLQRLQAKDVKTVVDVRKNNVSRFKLDFSGNTLVRLLREKGINYFHTPEFGIPSEEREEIDELEDFKKLWSWYDKHVVPNVHEWFNETVLKNMPQPVAFMCAEFDPTKCHRHRMTTALEAKGLRGFDL